jgi:hypothetical protein
MRRLLMSGQAVGSRLALKAICLWQRLRLGMPYPRINSGNQVAIGGNAISSSANAIMMSA